jgi:hypothetical protein
LCRVQPELSFEHRREERAGVVGDVECHR